MEKLCCENCGGDLVYNENEPVCKCPYCGTSFVVETLLEHKRAKVRSVHIDVDGHSIDVTEDGELNLPDVNQATSQVDVGKTASRVGIIILAIVLVTIISIAVTIIMIVSSVTSTVQKSVEIANLDGLNILTGTGTTTDTDKGYQSAKDYSEGFAAVSSNGKWGFINQSGTYLVSPQFDEVRYFSLGMAAVRTGSRWGFINNRGALSVSPQYMDVGFFLGDITWADRSDGMVLINRMDWQLMVILTLQYRICRMA
jgi:hypothetical protein